MKRWTLWAGLIFLCGCAPMNKNECVEADWYQLGRQDGARGAATEYFARRSEACREHGVTADRTAYYQGREEGLRLFCTPENGFALGRKGGRYTYICPADMEKAFLARYNEGLKDYRFEQAVRSLQSRMSGNEKAIQAMEEEMLAPKVSSTERYRLYREIKKLEEEQQEMQQELDFLLGGQDIKPHELFK